MAELNIITVGNAVHRSVTFKCPPQIPSIVEFKQMSKAIYNRLTNSQHYDLRASSRSEEFFPYALVGSPAGDDLAPAIWSWYGQTELFGKLCNAKNAFIDSGPFAIYFAANNFENVYITNTASTAIASDQETVSDQDINNVTTLSWDEVYNSMPQIDIAVVMYSHIFSDDQLFDSVFNALKPGGVIIITNSSNGGELYENLADKKPLHVAAGISPSAFLHKKIIDKGNFIVQHFQGWVSTTVCVKDNNE